MKKAFSKKNIWEAMPPFVKKVAGSLLSFVPLEYLIGGQFRETTKEILSADNWTQEEIKKYQLNKLLDQLHLAYDKCFAYKNLYDEANIDINSINTLEDFNQLPLIDKKFINENLDSLLLVDKNNSGIDYVTTGGTSGVPLAFYINASRSQVEYAYLVDGWRRAGFKLGDVKGVLRGRVTNSNSSLHQSYDPIFNEHYYSSFHTSEEDFNAYVAHLKTLQNCFLHVYPSSIYQLARFIKKKGIKIDNVKAILAESENVYPEQRLFVESVFNCRYYSSYGHSEKLVAAGECEFSSNYHVWPTYGYFELLDERGQKITEKGKVGEIVGTGFINTVMPFIRYKTGDYAEYVGNYCEKCKRNHLIVKNIRGHRIQEHLVADDHSLVSLTAINMHDDTFDNVLQYQFYQLNPGFAVLKVRVNNNFNVNDQNRILENLAKKLAGKVSITIIIVDSISLTKNGKSIFVDQKIDFSTL